MNPKTLAPGDGERMTIEVIISGYVQGVGFRACARKIAMNLGIYGEVRNLDDGRVLLLATAEPNVLEKLISMLYSCPRAVVRDLTQREIAKREFSDFSIKRSNF